MTRLTGRKRQVKQQRGPPWYAHARSMSKVLDGAQAAEATGDSLLWEDASAAIGVSSLMLKRFVTGLRNIERIAAESKTPVDALLSPSFTAAELAVRLYGRNSEAGLNALTDLAAGRTTIEAVRTALDEAPAKADPAGERSVSLKQRGRLLQLCEDALAAQAEHLFGLGSTVRRRPALQLFRRIGFEVFDSAGGLAGGADLYTAESWTASRDALEGLAQSVLLSFYLPSFLLLFGPGTTDETLTRADRALHTLNVPWIGIAAFEGDDEILPFRSRRGAPSPDRTDEYRQLRRALSMRRSDGDDPLA